MEARTAGRFRVLSRGDDAVVLVDLADTPDPVDAYEPVRVTPPEEDADLAAAVDDLEPGYVVEAELTWDDGAAAFRAVDVERRTRLLFADDVENLFEAARETWRDARAAGDAMNSRVTRDTDGEPNGALYAFADAGARDLLGEFRSGTTPLEPLIRRVNDERGPAEREVFVLRPADGAFVVVYVAFEKCGLLARTVRDTYFPDAGAGVP